MSGFILRIKWNQKLVLDVDGTSGIADSGTNVHLYEYNGSDAQKWFLIDDGQGYFYLQSNLKSGDGYDLVLGSFSQDSQLQVWSKNNSDSQKWSLDAKGTFISKLNGFALDAGDDYVIKMKYEGDLHVKRRVQMSQRTGEDKQIWILGFNSPSFFFLQNIKSSLVLGVEDSSAGEGTQVKIWTKNSTSSIPKEQLWKFTEEGYLQSALSPDLVLDVTNANQDNLATVQLHKKNNSKAQTWSFQADVTGGILRSGLNNKVLECMHSGSQPGTPADLYDFNYTLAQRWTMVSLPQSKAALLFTDVIIPEGTNPGDELNIPADDSIQSYVSFVVPQDKKVGDKVQVLVSDCNPDLKKTGVPMIRRKKINDQTTDDSKDPAEQYVEEFVIGEVIQQTIVEPIQVKIASQFSKIAIVKEVATTEGKMIVTVAEKVGVKTAGTFKGTYMKLMEGFNLEKKFLIKLGEDMEYQTAFGRGISFFVEGGFFEISMAASISAWAASTIADKLGANKLVHDVADIAGGALGGAVMGARLGGARGALLGAAVGVVFELINLGVEELGMHIPPISWTSEQSFDSITIYNSTPYDWIRDVTKSHAYQLSFWDECFPDIIPAGNIVVCPVIATIGSSYSTQVNTDSGGDHYFIVKDGRDSCFHLHYQYPRNFTVNFKDQHLTLTKTQVTAEYTDNFFFLNGSPGNYHVCSDISFLNTPIKNAVYIQPKIDASFALDICSSVNKPGTQVQLWKRNNTQAQQWLFTDEAYVQSALKAEDGSDLVLDVINANTAEGAKLQIWPKNGGNAQKWTFNAQGNLVSKLNGYVLDVPNSKAESGVLVQLWPPNGTDAQRWNIDNPEINTAVPSSTPANVPSSKTAVVYIKSKFDANFTLDVCSSVNKPGTQVQLWKRNNTQGQQWLFTDDGYVQSALKAENGSDLVLDVVNANTAEGAKLQIWSKNGGNAQKWTLSNQGNLVSKLNGYVLDVPNSKAESGVLVQLWPANGTDAQRWNIDNLEINTAVPSSKAAAVYIKSKIDANFTLDVCSSVNKPGTQVQLWKLNNTQAQQWLFTDDGYVQSALKAENGFDLVLDVKGAKLQIWPKNGRDAQKWTLNAQGNLVSKLNGYVLDVPNSKAESGVLVQLWPANGTDAQRWSIN